ncbi:hypothetical protein, partial [Bradyrhizobium liaoningense]|uniref:hypothetical protein n=1 Tax=Bradyrhizobium liaoningense TaxID=43992 RepID=UPI001BAC00AC
RGLLPRQAIPHGTRRQYLIALLQGWVSPADCAKRKPLGVTHLFRFRGGRSGGLRLRLTHPTKEGLQCAARSAVEIPAALFHEAI